MLHPCNKTAIQFGAGNIGRGFLAQLFHETGLEVVFVDVAGPVIEAINTRGRFDIDIVGEGAARVPIDNIRAIHASRIQEIAGLVAECEIACTAVGASVLPHTAPAVADGLIKRHANGGPPLNIVLCENLHNAADVLRESVGSLLPAELRAEILASTGFVQAVVSRMVPFQTEETRALDPLGIRVEAYKRLPIDSCAWVGDKPAVEFTGFEPVAPFEAYIERKLFTHNCAHAVLGYLGYRAGRRFGFEALRDSSIAGCLRAVLDETGRALTLKHGFDSAQHEAHVADLLRRFDNPELGDTCIRLARDPLRKLAPGDRIVGAARCCESQHVPTDALAAAIAVALTYDDPDDASAVRLQQIMSEQGIDGALETVCGIHRDEPLAVQVKRSRCHAKP